MRTTLNHRISLRLSKISAYIIAIGAGPAVTSRPDGIYLFDTLSERDGSAFVIGPNDIWYLWNNDAIGEGLGQPKAAAGGVSVIAWRIPFDANIAAELHRLAAGALSDNFFLPPVPRRKPPTES